MPRTAALVAGTLAFDTVARAHRLPGDDEAARVVDRSERGGGAGANVAHALARLGLAAPLLTAHGPDFTGSGYEAELKEVGVDLEPAVEGSDPTARAWIFSGPEGRQRIYYDPGATPGIHRCPVPGDVWQGWGHFAAGAIDAYPDLMAKVDEVTFDPGQEVFHRDLDEIEACFPYADVLVVNEHERDRLVEGLDPDPLELVGRSLQAVVVTRGGEPTEVHRPEGLEEVPVPGAEVEDPTGAGDAQSAGTVAGLAMGLDLVEAVRLGNVVGASTVETMGTQGGHPSMEAARDRYEDAYGAVPW